MPPSRIGTRALLVAPLIVAACGLSLFGSAAPSSRIVISPTPAVESAMPLPTFMQSSAPTPTGKSSAPLAHLGTTAAIPFCLDQRPRTLIAQFKSAILNADGDSLASLVSPVRGLDARLFRDGRIVNYDHQHAAALFESMLAVDWGDAPGSGLATIGSFRELFVPDLLDVLTKDYELACNEVRVGGTTHSATWPYAGLDFYSLHFPGSQSYDGMDWHTWLLGVHDVGGRAYLYAMMQFSWEP